MAVDQHALLGIERDSGLREPKPIGERYAADRDEHDIGFNGFGRTACSRLDVCNDAPASRLDRGDLARQPNCDALLFENALKRARDFVVYSGQNSVEVFDDEHVRAEALPDGPEFESDDAGADDEKPARHSRQVECASRRHDALFIDLDPGKTGRIGPSRDDDRFCRERLRLTTGRSHGDLPRFDDAASAEDAVDLVLLQEICDAIDVTFDAFAFERLHRRQI